MLWASRFAWSLLILASAGIAAAVGFVMHAIVESRKDARKRKFAAQTRPV